MFGDKCNYSWLTATAWLLLWLAMSDAAMGQFGGGGLGGGGGQGAPPAAQKKKRYVPTKFAPETNMKVAEVRLQGKCSISESKLRAKLQTREGRPFDPVAVQADVRQLVTSGLCYDVNTYNEESPEGVIITFELFEQPTIKYIRFEGNKVREKTLLKKSELAVGQPLVTFRVDEAKRRLEEYYRSRGNSRIQINIAEGSKRQDQGIVFQIDEGPRQRIRWTSFEGNTIASDARLRTVIDSKPGIMWLIKGQVDQEVIDEDVEKLTSYYRSLGFFRAVIQKEMKFDSDEEWLDLSFLIDEGPRYEVQNVSIQGNQVFRTEDLFAALELQTGEHFDQDLLNRDLTQLRDAYGSQGYVNVNIEPELLFHEEPGRLDLIYRIEEGTQHRVRNIVINIDGEHPHTRHAVILNRLAIAEGDIIDSRKLRDAKRRLTSSRLFETGPTGGPEINVVPIDASQIAGRPTDERY